MSLLSPGQHVWLEPGPREKRGEFDVAIGAVVVSSDAHGVLVRDDDKKVSDVARLGLLH